MSFEGGTSVTTGSQLTEFPMLGDHCHLPNLGTQDRQKRFLLQHTGLLLKKGNWVLEVDEESLESRDWLEMLNTLRRRTGLSPLTDELCSDSLISSTCDY